VHFLNTNTDDLLNYARNEGASVPIADTEITEDEYDDADNIIIEEENHKDIAHACSSPMRRPSLLRGSQLELSSTDSILLEFCEFHFMQSNYRTNNHRCQPHVLNMYTVRWKR
jgi:hypothetical protein